MNHPVAVALSDFSSLFLQAWRDAGHGFPRSEDLVGLSHHVLNMILVMK